MSNRIETLLGILEKHHLDSILLTSKANVYYLSNYYTEPHERVIAVYVSNHHDPLLIVPAMEETDARNAGWQYEIIGYHDHENVWELFRTFIKKSGKLPETIGLEHNHLTVERYKALQGILAQAVFADASDIIASMRVIKTAKEYTLLKEAAALADFGVKTGIKAIEAGRSELGIIAEIEYALKKQGVQEMSFSTMVLSGDKTASPHGTPGMNKITSGDLILFDLGVVFEGYCSDITRTVAYKSIRDDQRDIYNTVLTAEEKAIAASVNNTPVGNIDKAARDHINAAGYGEYFNHRIGHGIGVETHEYPSMHSNNDLTLEPGMCYTIEPGIYIPGKGGVRIEDMIFMTEKGPEVLTETPKQLQIIG